MPRKSIIINKDDIVLKNQNKSEKVVIVHGYSHHVFGSEIVALDVGDSYRRAGKEVIYFLPEEGPFSTFVRAKGFRVEVQKTIIGSLRKPGRDLFLPIQFLARIIRIKPKIIHSTSLGPLPAILPTGKILGCKIVTQLQTVYGADDLRRCLIQYSDLILPVSDAAEKPLLEYLKEMDFRLKHKSRVLFPPIRIPEKQHFLDAEKFRQKWGMDANTIAVGMVGQVINRKGVDLFLKAVAALLDEGWPIVPVLVGDTPQGSERYEQEINSLVSELKLQGVLQRFAYTKQIEPLFAALDVVAVPSRNEGLGLVAGEAIMAGAVPVVSRTGGLPQLVNHGKSGILVKSDCPGSLCKGLRFVLKDKDLRESMVKFGQMEIKGKFSHHIFDMSLWDAVIGELATERN